MTWTTITNAQLAVGAPLRSIDIVSLRDNITALADGDTGAPRIQDKALADGLTGGTYYYELGNAGFIDAASSAGNYVQLASFRFLRGGTFKFKFNANIEGIGGTILSYISTTDNLDFVSMDICQFFVKVAGGRIYLKVYKNGAAHSTDYFIDGGPVAGATGVGLADIQIGVTNTFSVRNHFASNLAGGNYTATAGMAITNT